MVFYKFSTFLLRYTASCESQGKTQCHVTDWIKDLDHKAHSAGEKKNVGLGKLVEIEVPSHIEDQRHALLLLLISMRPTHNDLEQAVTTTTEDTDDPMAICLPLWTQKTDDPTSVQEMAK